MAKKEFTYKGFNVDQIKKMSLKELSDIVPSRIRRTLKRGFNDYQKALIKKVEKNDPNIKTHCRDMVILPIMFDKKINVYNGKEFQQVMVAPDMIGHVLGEFTTTRKKVAHSAPGIGATKSSASVSVK